MKENINKFWRKKCESCAEALGANNFDVYLAENLKDAEKIVLEDIIPALDISTVSWGDSVTFLSTGILDYLRQQKTIEVIEIAGKDMSFKKQIQQRREALLADLFFTGTNAVTGDGLLVNLDMIGNRAGAITFGPKYVVILVGRNKITPDLDSAMERTKHIAAPINAARFNLKAPCVSTASCHDCASPDRICNVWTITEKSYPAGRIKIILINQDIGF